MANINKDRCTKCGNAMKEYIERDPLLSEVRLIMGDVFAAPIIVSKIENAPVSFVEDIKYGYWVQDPRGFCSCSECKTEGSPGWKRCPVCEAKMNQKEVCI